MTDQMEHELILEYVEQGIAFLREKDARKRSAIASGMAKLREKLRMTHREIVREAMELTLPK